MKLDLPDSCATAPTRLDVAAVEAFMLWPDDEEGRQRWLDAVNVHVLATVADNLPIQALRDALKTAATTPPLAALQDGAGQRYAHGWIAGEILGRAVCRAEASAPVVLDPIIGEICKAYAAFRRKGRIGATPEPKTIKNKIWPLFRPVAHLWAAYTRNYGNGCETWPCSIGGLPDFLADARAFQRKGESARTKQGPVLRQSEALEIDVPGLPEIDFTITS